MERFYQKYILNGVFLWLSAVYLKAIVLVVRVDIHMYTDAEKVQLHSWSWLRGVNDTAEKNGTAESHTAVSMT